jgi:hypothetical protein
VTATKQQHPECWWFLSFTSSTAFLGGAFVRARGPVAAVLRARNLGIAPDSGDVECTPMDDDEIYRIPPELRNRSLTEEEVRELGGE